MMIRGQRTEDRGLRVERHAVAQAEPIRGNAATKPQSSVLGSQSSERAFTLVELLVVIAIVSILASTLFTRVLFYQEMAEKAAMQQVVGALKSALVLQYGHRMASGMAQNIKNISKENPLDWLSQKPENYAGEFASSKRELIGSGSWAFDRGADELVYFPNHDEYFSPGKDGVRWIRFRVQFAYDVMPGSKVGGSRVLTGVTFAPVEPYQWLIRENK